MTDDKVVPFPPRAGSPEPEPIAKRQQRVILSIGSQRLAFDFYHEVTELNPAPAPVIPVDRSNREKCGSPASNKPPLPSCAPHGPPLGFPSAAVIWSWPNIFNWRRQWLSPAIRR